jgi:hypothetical protein
VSAFLFFDEFFLVFCLDAFKVALRLRIVGFEIACVEFQVKMRLRVFDVAYSYSAGGMERSLDLRRVYFVLGYDGGLFVYVDFAVA